LAHLLKDALVRLNLNIANLRFQTYDGLMELLICLAVIMDAKQS